MSQISALNDDEVRAEMNKMVEFIKQEAREKAREITVKANEEFNIEKAKLVRQESINIEAAFQRKIKQAQIQKKIAQSNYINKSRLKVLQARHQKLEDLFAEARSKLHDVGNDQERYRKLLSGLILQGLFQVMDENVSLIVKKSEVHLVESVLAEVVEEYKKSTHLPVKIVVDPKEHLPESNAGGVILTSHFGRIIVNNTLEERLSIAEEEMLPEIRVLLFGHSPNRNFFN
ncbi:hypothetical protein G9A89_023959 [Geosiphon pyriformis]|nr:hypothetical protein G9A89_023959 [Geosiphon pyriformis]